MALSTLFSSSSYRWFAAAGIHKLRWSQRSHGRPTHPALRHPLILDGLSAPPRALALGFVETSACTFYLVFKEPDWAAPPATLDRPWGNLPILLALRSACQAPDFSLFPAELSFQEAPGLVERWPGMVEPSSAFVRSGGPRRTFKVYDPQNPPVKRLAPDRPRSFQPGSAHYETSWSSFRTTVRAGS